VYRDSLLVHFPGVVAGGRGEVHHEGEEQRQFAEKQITMPAVSVLKPVHGAEKRLKENIESFFRQDYAEYEILLRRMRKPMPRWKLCGKLPRAIRI